MTTNKSAIKSARQKALDINLDEKFYGVFAEIGAGQEVARHFFQAGAASQTVAKTICAYDMIYSDHIYGKEESGRYVCQSRLEKMLDREYNQITERLDAKRGSETNFFAYCNTVAIRNFHGTNDPHGWMGVRFQHVEDAQPSQMILHVRMFDNSALQQQDVLGVVGVNLCHTSFYHRSSAAEIISTLIENVSSARLEIDMIKISGPAFEGMDNRLIDLELVQQGVTNAVLFGEDGEVKDISENLYKKNLLVARGSFRPPTLVNEDILIKGLESFCKVNSLKTQDVTTLAEITVGQLDQGQGSIDAKDFLDRLDILASLKIPVMISNYKQYYKLSNFFSRFKCKHVGLVLGVYNFLQIFDKKYNDAKGGLLESLGRLFRDETQVYVYPSTDDQGNFLSLENITIPKKLQHLTDHLRSNQHVHSLDAQNPELLHIYSRKVLELIKKNDPSWEKMVPKEVAQVIKNKKLFGYQ